MNVLSGLSKLRPDLQYQWVLRKTEYPVNGYFYSIAGFVLSLDHKVAGLPSPVDKRRKVGISRRSNHSGGLGVFHKSKVSARRKGYLDR